MANPQIGCFHMGSKGGSMSLKPRATKTAWLEYTGAVPLKFVEGFEVEENECVSTLLAGIPNEGGSATKLAFEMLVRMAFQGGLVAWKMKTVKSAPAEWWNDGIPCDHRGCESHVTHPCEGCGRTAARGRALKRVKS